MAQQAQSLADKVRNLTPAELHARESEQSEQLFKLKFQMKMGQTESVKKMRELRKEIARIKTVAREKELGIGPAVTERKPARNESGQEGQEEGPEEGSAQDGRPESRSPQGSQEEHAQEDGEEVSHGRNDEQRETGNAPQGT